MSDLKDLEARVEKLERGAYANKMDEMTLRSVYDLWQTLGGLSGIEAFQRYVDSARTEFDQLAERVETESEKNRKSVEQNTVRVQEFWEGIKKYYTTALKEFYEYRNSAYSNLNPDVLVKEVVELLRQDAQAELEFRQQLIDKIVDKISARFDGVVPTRQATREELNSNEHVLVVRPATHAEAQESIGREHLKREKAKASNN